MRKTYVKMEINEKKFHAHRVLKTNETFHSTAESKKKRLYFSTLKHRNNFPNWN